MSFDTWEPRIGQLRIPRDEVAPVSISSGKHMSVPMTSHVYDVEQTNLYERLKLVGNVMMLITKITPFVANK